MSNPTPPPADWAAKAAEEIDRTPWDRGDVVKGIAEIIRRHHDASLSQSKSDAYCRHLAEEVEDAHL